MIQKSLPVVDVRESLNFQFSGRVSERIVKDCSVVNFFTKCTGKEYGRGSFSGVFFLSSVYKFYSRSLSDANHSSG